MSNRSSRRATRPQGGFMQSLQAVAEQAKAAQESDEEESGIPEAGGTLPKPNTQELRGTFIRWTWIPCPKELHRPAAKVTATYSRTSRDYKVEVDVDQSNAIFDGDQAKAFGEALISAWQWQFIWQQNVGQFLVEADSPENNVENLPMAPYPGQAEAPDDVTRGGTHGGE